jgi:predicted alpha/beta superfamily hydrolase
MRLRISFLLVLISVSGVWAQQPIKADSAKPIIVGKTVYIKSSILGEERALNIYLPAGYNEKDTTRYSVVYLLDGSMDEDFINVSGQYYFNTFPWVNRTPNSIIVGIANVDRKRDFTYPSTVQEEKEKFPTTGHSANFIAFIEKELQPYIERSYKTNASKTIIGESLGGLLATEILFKKPELFNNYVIISPSLWWDDGSLLKDSIKSKFGKKTLVYIGAGREGLAPSRSPHVSEVDAKQLADKLNNLKDKNLNVYYDYLPEENHATISEPALFDALKWLGNN